jgi:hypothetical protein
MQDLFGSWNSSCPTCTLQLYVFVESYRDKLDALLQQTRAIPQDGKMDGECPQEKGEGEEDHGLMGTFEKSLSPVMHSVFEIVDFFFSFARIMNHQNASMSQNIKFLFLWFKWCEKNGNNDEQNTSKCLVSCISVGSQLQSECRGSI